MYIYYWCGKPYDIDVILTDWSDKEVIDKGFTLIDKFMKEKELYKKIEIFISTWDSKDSTAGTVTFLLFRNINNNGIIKLNKNNIKEKIIEVLESKFPNEYDLELRKIIKWGRIEIHV